MGESVMRIEAVGSGSGSAWAQVVRRLLLCLLLGPLCLPLAGCADRAELDESELAATATSSEDSVETRAMAPVLPSSATSASPFLNCFIH